MRYWNSGKHSRKICFSCKLGSTEYRLKIAGFRKREIAVLSSKRLHFMKNCLKIISACLWITRKHVCRIHMSVELGFSKNCEATTLRSRYSFIIRHSHIISDCIVTHCQIVVNKILLMGICSAFFFWSNMLASVISKEWLGKSNVRLLIFQML